MIWRHRKYNFDRIKKACIYHGRYFKKYTLPGHGVLPQYWQIPVSRLWAEASLCGESSSSWLNLFMSNLFKEDENRLQNAAWLIEYSRVPNGTVTAVLDMEYCYCDLPARSSSGLTQVLDLDRWFQISPLARNQSANSTLRACAVRKESRGHKGVMIEI